MDCLRATLLYVYCLHMLDPQTRQDRTLDDWERTLIRAAERLIRQRLYAHAADSMTYNRGVHDLVLPVGIEHREGEGWIVEAKGRAG